MLATEETKTVWRDLNGTPHDSKDGAERTSMRKLINAYIPFASPQGLVTLLKSEPEAKAWLLQQLGEQPVTPMEGNPATALEAMWLAVGEYMLEVHGKPGSLFSQVQDAAAVYGILDFLRGLAKHIPHLQPAAQPQQQEVDISVAFGNATRIALKGEAVHALDKISEMAIKRVMQELQKAGYKLVKA